MNQDVSALRRFDQRRAICSIAAENQLAPAGLKDETVSELHRPVIDLDRCDLHALFGQHDTSLEFDDL